jgi:hypothetical protein
LYATSLPIRDLRQPGFCNIETLDAHEGTEYQRVLKEARAKRFSAYLLDAHEADEAFLLTTLLLATEKVLPFDEATSMLAIDHNASGPFYVVGGQHSIQSHVSAAERDPGLDDFEVPVNIAVGPQMAHFHVEGESLRERIEEHDGEPG